MVDRRDSVRTTRYAERVREVHIRIAQPMQLMPTHVGNGSGVRESDNVPLEDPQPFRLAMLEASREEELHSQTDPDERTPGPNVGAQTLRVPF
jgi:hypothetical protein